jgi:putative transposase
MILEELKYYHIYNRSNNQEVVFKAEENYQYFLTKFNEQLNPFIEIIAYCLMPTHFHFLAKIRSNADMIIQKRIGLILSSYTKAINKRYHRNGALFQPHTKAKEITDEQYLFTLISYIHQNPLRSQLVQSFEEWKWSSYIDIVQNNGKSFISREFYRANFKSIDEFKRYSKELVDSVRKEYWV